MLMGMNDEAAADRISGGHPSARAYADALGVRETIEREIDAQFPARKGPIAYRGDSRWVDTVEVAEDPQDGITFTRDRRAEDR